MRKKEIDWTAAEKYLHEAEEAYRSIGFAGWFGLAFMKPLRDRYTKGERTQKLYDEIMEIQI